MVHSLIESYELLQHMTVVPSIKATLNDLQLFHSSAYVQCIKNAIFDDSDEIDEEQTDFGLGETFNVTIFMNPTIF